MWTGDFIEGKSWGECKNSAQVEYQLPPPAPASCTRPAACARPAVCKRLSSCTWNKACTRPRAESRPSPHGARTERTGLSAKGLRPGLGQFRETCPPVTCRAPEGARGRVQRSCPAPPTRIPRLSCALTWMKARLGDPAYGKPSWKCEQVSKTSPSPGLVAAGDVPTAFPVLRGVVLRSFIFPYNSLFSQ